jgi:hypothetical protein
MKTHLAQVFAMVAAPLWGVLIPALGCSATDSSDPAMAEEQEAMSPEGESVVTGESALEEASEEASSALNPQLGTCYMGPKCNGTSLRALLTRVQCKENRGKSWRAQGSTQCVSNL